MPKITRVKTSAGDRRRLKLKKRRTEREELDWDRREPTDDWLRYAYLITGDKKIGKTSLAIEGAEEYVLQFDKPQLAYRIREKLIRDWDHFKRVLREIERRVEAGKWEANRIVVDGAGEWFTMVQRWACAKLGIQHPSDAPFAQGWHLMRDEFTDAVNRLLRLQETASCGLIFIAHCEWKEIKRRDGSKVEKLVPNLSNRCEEILGGKVDGWFVYTYSGRTRVLVVVGDEETGAGHRIDGRFLTADGRRVREIDMGRSPADALAAFEAGFRNELEHADLAEARTARLAEKKVGGSKVKVKV